MSDALVTVPTRLPMPSGLDEIDAGKWRVLCESVFPSAKSPSSILMALDYCRVRKLDIFKKPVNIVPMWSSEKRQYIETVWPGINETQITAARTGSYAGMDKPVWGDIIIRKFKGRKKKDDVGETTIEVSYPEYCEVTVYRLIDGQRYAFTEQVFWAEAYGRVGQSELPNDMWAKRPHGQLHKCAKAASLRAAFPEETGYTSDEMEGRTIEEMGEVAVVAAMPEAKAAKVTKDVYGSQKARNDRFNEIIAEIKACEDSESLKSVWRANQSHIKAIKEGKDGEVLFDQLESAKDEAKRRIEDSNAIVAGFGGDFPIADAESEEIAVVPEFLKGGEDPHGR